MVSEQDELEKTRKDLVDARVQFEDDRWLQKQRDSDSRAWCKPVARELQLDTPTGHRAVLLQGYA
jgi:hypothetical protein